MLDIKGIACVGCTACASICPANVIVMKKNAEGFFCPTVQNEDKCLKCGLCEKVCPVLNNEEAKKRVDIGLIAQNSDEGILKESASGGMFSAIATVVLDRGGVVFGAAYSDSFEVCHVAIEKKEDLWRLRNSKYVQSNLCSVYKQVKEHLVSGKEVCFSGTPCQIEGLRRFLIHDYENLILVDIVCHGVSSPLIWEKYLETVNRFSPKKIAFRWKHYGYKYSTMSVFDDQGKEVYFAGVESDKMLRAYFSNSCDRITCYDCMFKKRYRVSDFTMWDCFQPKVFNKEFDNDKGCSCVLINSEKGKILFETIEKKGLVKYQYVPADELTFGNNELIRSVKKGDKREELLKDAAVLTGEQLFEKHFPTSFMTKVRKVIRLVLLKSGLYSFFKYCLFIYRRKKFRKT